MSDPDFDSFELWPRGNLFEDFRIGRHFDHHWGRTLHAGDATLFSCLALRYCPLYTNAEYARAAGHPDLVLDPLLVLATVIGLSVEDLSEAGGPFLGVDDVVFHRPVYPGDTIACESVVVDRRESESRPEAGIVSWRTTARNAAGEVVLTYQRTNLIARGEPAR